MPDAILVLNAGSSSLKFSVFLDGEPPERLLHGQIESLFTEPKFIARNRDDKVVGEHTWAKGTTLGHESAVEYFFKWGRDEALTEHRLLAAGHRVVHGGTRLVRPVRIDNKILAELDALVPLAPLHEPPEIAVIRAVIQHAPELPQVACFDTAFHSTQPAVARAIALPRRYTQQGILRYGFHGLSYEYIASVLPGIDVRAAAGRTIVAHLGNGASLCAMQSRRSVATTMGFTPLDGLVMGTRCGSIDPGVILFLMDQHRLDARALEQLLYNESGLLGVSGISSDMRTLLNSSDPRAAEAVDLFVYRVVRELGSMAAALGGLDALVFTGGIGENAAAIRARVCRDSAWLGLELDEAANTRAGSRITHPGSRVSAWVIPTNEERMIAIHTKNLIGAQ
jgi:acetate kinase